MTDMGAIAWLSEKFGGRVIESHPRQRRVDGGPRRTFWTWSISGRPLTDLLESLLPFMKTKREIALVALEFSPFWGQADTSEQRKPLAARIVALNNR